MKEYNDEVVDRRVAAPRLSRFSAHAGCKPPFTIAPTRSAHPSRTNIQHRSPYANAIASLVILALEKDTANMGGITMRETLGKSKKS
jgi:hypothetical protein